jgi:hypothetical protein
MYNIYVVAESRDELADIHLYNFSFPMLIIKGNLKNITKVILMPFSVNLPESYCLTKFQTFSCKLRIVMPKCVEIIPFMSFNILRVVNVKITVFWNMTP